MLNTYLGTYMIFNITRGFLKVKKKSDFFTAYEIIHQHSHSPPCSGKSLRKQDEPCTVAQRSTTHILPNQQGKLIPKLIVLQ